MLRFIKRLFHSALLLCALWSAGLLWFVSRMPCESAPDSRRADVLVVLTGGAGRLEHGLRLLKEGKAGQMFISGVSKEVALRDLARAIPADLRHYLLHPPPDTVFFGREAENTIGNAEEVRHWLEGKPHQTLRIVTANYHMPRSIEEFEEALPGTTLIPDPVSPPDFNRKRWWQSRDDIKLVLSEYHKFLASKLRHWYVAMRRK